MTSYGFSVKSEGDKWFYLRFDTNNEELLKKVEAAVITHIDAFKWNNRIEERKGERVEE